ncbi:hypothetical protein HPB52_021009 [Rhipicephalus sanguineus]|uniref:OTU domain-containing protein n=1 Tax=Rhipicephalus sanguineus TaxID=34632 RepID=A0A9D4QC00_RHISA|nr:hypothetical protein HPB52_021009 [Rhipicephalus sanguineus]
MVRSLVTVQDLRSKYSHIRKTRPDGNCFFRAIQLRVPRKPVERQGGVHKARSRKSPKTARRSWSRSASSATIEDFHDTFMDVLKRIENNISLEDLLKIFNDRATQTTL